MCSSACVKVSVLQSGVVLDTTVHAVVTYRTEIVRAYRGALTEPRDGPRRDLFLAEIGVDLE